MSNHVGHRESAREWWDQAACARVGSPDWWDNPSSGVTLDHARAVAVCVTCPVKDRCLADAVAAGGEHNIRAGLFPAHQFELIRSGSTRPRLMILVQRLMDAGKDWEAAAHTAYGRLRV